MCSVDRYRVRAGCAAAEPQAVVVDCANGVGAAAASAIAATLLSAGLHLRLVNDAALDDSRRGTPVGLNERCGSDHVQNTHLWPFEAALPRSGLACSFDGDADRIVFYTAPAPRADAAAAEPSGAAEDTCGGHDKGAQPAAAHSTALTLLDGDYIAALFALHLQDVLQRSQLTQQLKVGELSMCGLHLRVAHLYI